MGAQESPHTFQQKLDALLSYGGGGGLTLASFLADLSTIAQQLGMIIGCAVMAFKLYRDAEAYVHGKSDKRSGNKNGAGKSNPPSNERG